MNESITASVTFSHSSNGDPERETRSGTPAELRAYARDFVKNGMANGTWMKMSRTPSELGTLTAHPVLR